MTRRSKFLRQIMNLKKMRFIIGLYFIVPFVFQTANSQEILEDNDFTNQLWVSYDLSFKMSELTDFSTELGYKTIWPEVWNRYYFKPTFKFNIPKFMLKKMKYREVLSAGIAFYYTDNFYDDNRLEIRPFQGYLLDWPDWTHFRIRHYFRLEERFDLNTSDWVNTFGLRFRYLLDLTFKLQGDIVPDAKGIYIPINVEFFWNLIGTKQFNDVMRTNIGVGNAWSNRLRTELLFGYQKSRNTTAEDFSTNDVIYQLKIFHKID